VFTSRFSFLRFAARRLAFAAALVFVAASAALILTRLAPGDATTELRLEGVSAATLSAERAHLRLDESLAKQYIAWLADAWRLDFGVSFRYARPVGPLVLERAGNTALLAVTALLLATVTGLPLGILTATRPRSVAARLVRGASVVALSLPPMLLALGLAVLAARTGWLPIGGMRSAVPMPGTLAAMADIARHLVVPALALAIPVAALFERLQSRALAATLREPCLVAAATRGVPGARLHFVHGLRLSITPVASLYGVVAGGLLGGSFTVEIVTSWPGLGRLLYEGLISRDLYLVAGCAAVGAVFVAAATLTSDLVAAWNDPRLREAAAS
jgi:peptide/nickel transport system permease protein